MWAYYAGCNWFLLKDGALAIEATILEPGSNERRSNSPNELRPVWCYHSSFSLFLNELSEQLVLRATSREANVSVF